MISPRFIYNLRNSTFNERVFRKLSPYGYLLAPNNATPQLLTLADRLLATRRKFLVDNGNFTLIGQVRKQYSQKAADLRKKMTSLEERLGRSARSGDVPANLRRAYRSLARQSRDSARDVTGSGDDNLDEQLALKPTHIVGVEDITAAVWLSLDIERAYPGYRLRDYRRQNERVARLAVSRLAALPETLANNYYPVASAVSYNTARDAGRVFGGKGIKKISMGFGAYMADRNYTDHMYVDRRRIDFGTRLPARYSRTVAVARGFWDGYQEATGSAPEAFHFLGLGAPIMIPLVVLAASATGTLSFDATSPIKDAVRGGTLYVTKPAYLKVRTRKVARRLASDSSRTWDCPCPFCQAFDDDYPFQYDIGHDWFAREEGRKVVAGDLRPGGGLYDAYPLFSEPSGGQRRRAVNFARIGHNHWAIERIITSVKRAARDRRLEKRVANIVSAYTGNTSPVYANALRFALDFASTGDAG